MSTVLKGKMFEDEVSELYRLMGYMVEQNVGVSGHQIDIILTYTLPGGIKTKTAVECKYVQDGNLKKNDVMSNILALADLKINNQVQNLIVVTTNGFAKDIWDTAKINNVKLLTIGKLRENVVDFESYIDRIIYDFEHWHEYNDNQRKPIIELFNRADLHKTYVNLRCKDSHGKVYDPIDRYIESWLKKEDKNHITLLGDYGTGKSSFLLYLTYILAKSFKKNPFNLPIPVFISLKNYSRTRSLKETILEILKDDYNIIFRSPTYFQNLLDDGKIILLLDGFDEIEMKSNKDIIIKLFDEITKLVTKKSKMILTSRTHYFKTHSHVNDIFNPQYDTELLKMIRGNHKFEIIELLEFNNEQIIEFLSLHTEDYMEIWNKIKSTYNLEDLSKRPILLEMIIRSLPTLMKEGYEINSSKLYQIYTDIWVKREDWRSIMDSNEKTIFMEELALHMFLNNIQSVRYNYLNQIVLGHFKRKILSNEDADIFDTDTRTCSFLNRDMDGNYKFTHKSFMEFFVAKKFYREINEDKIVTFKIKPLSPEIIDFMGKLDLDKNKIYDTIYLTANHKFEDVRYIGGNAISILTRMGETLTNKDFSNTILQNANFEGAICDNSNFSNAELQNSNFIDSSLIYANFEGAKLDGSIIEGMGRVTVVSLDKNEKNIVFGTTTGNVCIVNLTNFQKVNSFKQTNFPIEKVRFFGEDKYLGFTDSHKQIFVFNLTSFEPYTIKENIVKCIDFSPFCSEISILISNMRIKVIDVVLKTEKLIELKHEDENFSEIAYLGEQNLLSLISKNKINIINLEDGITIKSLKTKLDNIDYIDYGLEEGNLLHLRQNTKTLISNNNYSYSCNYEIIDLNRMESKLIEAGLIGTLSRKANLMLSVEFNEEGAKFKIKDLKPNMALFNWDNVPGSDENSLLKFLKIKFGIDLINTEIHKSDIGNSIHIRNYEKLAEIIVDGTKENKVINGHRIKVIRKNNSLTIYAIYKYGYGDKAIYSVGNIQTASEDAINSGSYGFLNDLGIYTVYEKIYKSTDGKTISIYREKIANLTIDEIKEIVILEMSNGITYEFKLQRENGELKVFNTILAESYNTSLEMLYPEKSFETAEDLDLIQGNEFTKYIPPIVFSKNTKSVYIADYSGNLILWNWIKEPSMKDKGYINWNDHHLTLSSTMLKSKYINEDLFKCKCMNLHNASGLKEEQIEVLKKLGAFF